MNYLVIGGMMTCEGVQHQVRNLKLMLNLYLFLNLSLLSKDSAEKLYRCRLMALDPDMF